MRVAAVRAVGTVLGAALALATAACGQGTPGSPPDAGAAEAGLPAVDPGTLSTSPRGLAAAILEHVDASQVADLGGDGGAGMVHASVSLTAPDIETLFVMVTSSNTMPVQDCGTDFGYRVIECTNGPPHRELAVADRSECEGPTLMGRFHDEVRGSVLVELFGADTPANRRLVAGLVDDSSVGLTATAAAEAAGRDLAFGRSQLTTELEIGDGGSPPC